MNDNPTPKGSSQAASHRRAGEHRAHAGQPSEADRLRRSGFLHRALVPGVRAAQGHAREQVRDSGLGRPEGHRRPQGQVRRAQRRRPAGRLQGADGRLDSPERKAAIAPRWPTPSKAQYATDVTGPFADNNQRFSKTDPRIGYAEVQFSKDGFQLAARKIVELEDTIRARSRRPASRPSSRVTPIRRRPSRAPASYRHRRGADRAADRVPHVRGRGRPDPVRRPLGRHRLRPALPAGQPDRLQHDHADPRLDDRHRRRRRLHALHRHALQTGAARRHASTRGCRLRVGDRRPRGDLRRR